MSVARRGTRAAVRVRRSCSTVTVRSRVPPETDQDPVADGTRCLVDVLGVDPTELAERMGVDASLTIGAGLLQVPVDTRDYSASTCLIPAGFQLRSANVHQRTILGRILAV